MGVIQLSPKFLDRDMYSSGQSLNARMLSAIFSQFNLPLADAACLSFLPFEVFRNSLGGFRRRCSIHVKWISAGEIEM